MKTCDICGEPAIGIQFYGCCSTAVCREHADPRLLELEPGTKREWGVCYYWRFREPGSEE